MINLEPLAVRAAVTMVGGQDPRDAENMINKALMVLAEQGVTAFALFLASRTRAQDQVVSAAIHLAIRNLLGESGLGQFQNIIQVEDYKSLTQVQAGESDLSALQRLLLTKQLMETALTYGRYQAKAARQMGGG